MMLQPKRMKFRKYQKNIQSKKRSNLSGLRFGQYGIKALKSGYIPAKALEAMRQSLNKKLKKDRETLGVRFS
jgi:large subunit ribosomal protein L16